jgi:hypothetical protein
MASKRDTEGYLCIDNRVNEGLPDMLVMRAGLPPGAGRGLFESATICCSHCQAIVVLNPNRSRERAYCRKCDAYLCDGCGILLARTFECKTFNQVVDEMLESVAKNPETTAPTTLILQT